MSYLKIILSFIQNKKAASKLMFGTACKNDRH